MDKTEPLVSILIPVYNRQNLIKNTLESAINQTYNNIEVIVVDNFSTDNTFKILDEYRHNPKVKLFQNSRNLGPVLNWKKCLDEAKGQYIKILFSDDLISNNFIEDSLGIFCEDTAFVLSPIEIFSQEGTLYNSKYQNKSSYTVKSYLEDILLCNMNEFPVSPGCALFRTKDLKSSLLIDISNNLNLDFKRYGAGNDLMLYLLTSINYKKIRITKNSKSFFRHHQGSFSISNDLLKYYNFSKYFFITNFYPHLLSKFKSYLWFNSKFHKIENEVMKLVENRIDIVFLLKVILLKTFRKMQR